MQQGICLNLDLACEITVRIEAIRDNESFTELSEPVDSMDEPLTTKHCTVGLSGATV